MDGRGRMERHTVQIRGSPNTHYDKSLEFAISGITTLISHTSVRAESVTPNPTDGWSHAVRSTTRDETCLH